MKNKTTKVTISPSPKAKKVSISLTPKARTGRGGLINLLIWLLQSFALLLNKFTPFTWLLQIYNWVKSAILSFFTSFVIIRESFEYLNQLPVFQLMRKFIRILSIISLLFNLIIFGIFTQISPLLWISTIPGVSQIGAFVYESSPEKAQGIIMFISLKIKTFLLWIWNGIISFVKTVIKTVLGELESSPVDTSPVEEPPVDTPVDKPPVGTSPVDKSPAGSQIDPDKGKYGDINNGDYVNRLKNNLYDYKYYILGGFIIVGIGAVAYLYWESISSCWKGGDDRDPGEQFVPLPHDSEIHGYGGQSGQIPSPDSSNSSSGSFNRLFRTPIVDKVSNFRDKVKGYFGNKVIKKSQVGPVPRGIYLDNGREMYNGLILPRVEVLDNGTEYYFNKDTHGFISVLNNSYDSSNSVITINPFSGKALSSVPLSVSERISLINKARNSALYEAPINSFARNPVFEGITMDLGQPSLSSTSAASSSTLPDMSNESGFEDVELTPKAKPIDGRPFCSIPNKSVGVNYLRGG